MPDRSIPERKEINSKYKWDLTHIFPSDEEFEEALAEAAKYPAIIESYEGKISKSAKILLDYLRLNDRINERMLDILSYAERKSDEDTRIGLYSGYCDRANAAIVAINSACSFEEAEVLTISDEKLAEFMAEQGGLREYEVYLKRILARRRHILSPGEEHVAAMAGEMMLTPENIFSMLSNADMKFPDVVDKDGVSHPLTEGTYITYLHSEDRVLRKSAFEAIYKTYSSYGNTFSSIISGHLKTLAFNADIRGYENTLEAAIDQTEVPQIVYHSLIEAVHANFDKLHRYMRLRKKLMGLDELHYYDLYVPMISGVDSKIPYEAAVKTVLESIKPLGQEYTVIMKKGFAGGWIDVYENQGKRSGAYSAHSTAHPYVLLNHKEDLQSEFTLAHEMGHSLHTYLSCENQPPVYRHYQTFVAEVASTFNEVLLMQHLLENTQDKREKAYLINYFLEQVRTTLYRQTMFAEFELKINEAHARDEALTADRLCEMYGEINRLYFGEEVVFDEAISWEWTRVPHFYYDYYVYQYATGISAALALSQRVLGGGEKEAQEYLGFLKGGSSKSPIELLKDAGVDMTDPKVVSDALKLFGDLLDQMEQLADEL